MENFFFPRCIPLYTTRKAFFEFLNLNISANSIKIKIILNYHSVGPKEEFDEKNRGQKSCDTVPLKYSQGFFCHFQKPPQLFELFNKMITG